jgi:hypothetical protein
MGHSGPFHIPAGRVKEAAVSEVGGFSMPALSFVYDPERRKEWWSLDQPSSGIDNRSDNQIPVNEEGINETKS